MTKKETYGIILFGKIISYKEEGNKINMFCIKCGTEIHEGTKFCIKCGNPVAGFPAAPAQAQVQAAAPFAAPGGVAVKPKLKIDFKNKKVLIIAAVALVVVIAAIVLIVTLGGRGSGGYSTPEAAMEAYLDGFCNADFDRILTAYPDFSIKYNGGEDSIKRQLKISYDRQFGERAAKGYYYEYKAVGHTLLEKDEAKRIEKNMCAEFNTDVSFSAIATVDYKLSGGVGDTFIEGTDINTTGYAVKYKGKWYFINTF